MKKKVEITDKIGNSQSYDVRCSYLGKFVDPNQKHPVTNTIKQDLVEVTLFESCLVPMDKCKELSNKIIQRINDFENQKMPSLEYDVPVKSNTMERQIKFRAWDEGKKNHA